MNQYLDPDRVPTWLSKLWSNVKLQNSNIVAGINEDDCAIMKLPSDLLIITTDFLNYRPIAFELGIGNFWHLGRLVVASNLSDLCGTGAKPLAMLLAVTMKKESKFNDFKELAMGVKYELDRYNIPLIGGDTKVGYANSFLGIAIGTSNSNCKLFKKNGAESGDLLWVSGYLGSNSAAVNGLSRYNMPVDWSNWAKKVILEPNLPLNKSLALSNSKKGKGGIDISDGLGADLANLCDASDVGVVVEVDKIPIIQQVNDLAKLKKIQSWIYSFIVGGDFQFAVTSNKKCYNDMEELGFINIGYITKEKNKLLKLPNGTLKPMPTFGHKDARGKSFSDEIEYILNKINKEV
jgi:thiamine-monophosphate kinase